MGLVSGWWPMPMPMPNVKCLWETAYACLACNPWEGGGGW